jgi:hypothetical protein
MTTVETIWFGTLVIFSAILLFIGQKYEDKNDIMKATAAYKLAIVIISVSSLTYVGRVAYLYHAVQDIP